MSLDEQVQEAVGCEPVQTASQEVEAGVEVTPEQHQADLDRIEDAITAAVEAVGSGAVVVDDEPSTLRGEVIQRLEVLAEKTAPAREEFLERTAPAREEFLERTAPAREAARQQLEAAAERTAPAREAIRERVEDAYERTAPAREALKERVQDAYERTAPTREAIRERAQEAYDRSSQMRQMVSQRVHEAIANNIPELEGRRFDDDAVLSEEGDVDSLGFIMVLTELEDKLGVTIPDEEWDGLRTFGDLVNAFVARLKGARG